MHVAVVGAGSLGRVFGVRLANAGVAVDFVVRDAAGAAAKGALRIEQVHVDPMTLDAPSWVTSVPAHADVVLVCVRGDQLDDALLEMLRAAPSVPVVMITPMLPRTYARMRAAMGTDAGTRLATAMSSVVGYTKPSGVTRYWISKVAKTMIDEPRAREPALTAFVEALARAGIDAAFEPAVHETNAATTILFLPLTFGLDLAGSIDALMDDAALSSVMFRASDEARALAERCGKVAFWVGFVTRFLGPRTIRLGIAMLRNRSPEAVAFIEEHFGRKGHGQNFVMAAEACALAEEKGTPHGALDELLVRLRRSPA
jgi:ketopantoate reductase